MESQGCIFVYLYIIYIILSAKDFEGKYRDTDYRPMVERMELGCIVRCPCMDLSILGTAAQHLRFIITA